MRPAALLATCLIGLVACSPPNSGTVRGVVVEVDGGLTSVESFTVLAEGERLTFRPTADGDYAFPLPHLREHLRTGEPVLVGWFRDGDALVADFLTDG